MKKLLQVSMLSSGIALGLMASSAAIAQGAVREERGLQR